MFARISRKEVVVRFLLIAVVLFNAAVPTPSSASPDLEEKTIEYPNTQNSLHLQPSAGSLTDFQQPPLFFVPNLGQEDEAVRFQAKGLGGLLYFTPAEVVFSLPNPVKVSDENNETKEKIRYDLRPANVVRIHYQGANDNPEILGIDQLPGVVNYLMGKDPSRWLTDLPTYSGISYHELYPGIELRYEGTDGSIKSTFHVAPDADPSFIVWRYKDVQEVAIDEFGNLVITLPPVVEDEPGNMLVERAPIAWQEVNGERISVAVQYAVDSNNKKVSFLLPEGYDLTLPLVIDPELIYSTYLGGSLKDQAEAITLDADGNTYLTGKTYSSNFPTVNPFQTNKPSGDAFVTKLDPLGRTILYSTYIGGNGDDHGWGISLDSQGRINVVGETESSDFPTLNSFDTSYAGGTCESGLPCDDVFVIQLSANGSALRYSTYLGGASDDEAKALTIGPDNAIYLTGFTRSSTFPSYNAYQSTFGGGTCSGIPCADAFIAKVDPALTGTASLLYSTFLGGNYYDTGNSIVTDANGMIYVAGYAISTNFPTRNPYQATQAGSSDIFVAKFNTALSGMSSLLYSTLLGGNKSDHAYGLALGDADQVYITGYTASPNFPIQNAFDNLLDGTCGTDFCQEAYVTHLDIGNNTLVYSSYLGGSHDEEGSGIALDNAGYAYVTGYTRSVDFPLESELQPLKGGDSCSSPPCEDAFVAKVNPAGTALTYSTYLGGDAEDYGNAITADNLGGAYIVGYTYSSNFPTTNGSGISSTTYADAFVIKISDPLPPTPTPTGTSTPTPTATFTATPTVTKAPPAGVSCIDWRDGLSYGWIQSPWMDPSAQVLWDSNGMYGYATSGTTYNVGAYYQMPAGGSHKVLLNGQHLTDFTVAQGSIAPTSADPLSDNLVAATDGSYWVTDSFLEVRWFINVPVDLNTTSLFQSFCYSSYAPTSTNTPTLTPSFTATETSVPLGLVASFFDTDDEDWTVVNDANDPVYHAEGGNPGGYISATDKFVGPHWYWRAPAKFYGDFSLAYGRTLTFDLKQSPVGQTNRDDVILTGGGIQLIYNTPYNPGADWTSYSILLQESAGWINKATGNAATLAEIQTVLSALSDLQIRGEYSTSQDTGSLDNVVLGSVAIPTNTATPGPSPTPTDTPTPTNTPAPTLTPTPTLPSFQEMVIPGWIGSPAQQSTVSGVVPITLANGITLQSGTIDYWPVNDTSRVKVLGTVSNKTGGDTLVSLDTTTLANGSYVIRLQGVDGNGVQQDSGIMVTVTGEYKPGRVRFTITDLTIPVVGLPITIARTYDSLERNQVGDFGYGWSLAIGNPKLETDLAHNVTLTMPDGRRSVFYFTPVNYTSPYSLFKKPHYTPEAGVYGSLEAPDCLLILSGGQFYCFLEGDYQPTEYTYTDPFGRKFLMGAGGTLKTITDLNNNVLTFSSDGITSSAGDVQVLFDRDPQGRIKKITYPTGKDYLYSYDTDGNLETVTFPTVTQPSQQTIVLRYSYYPGDHFFHYATDPRNIQPVITTYDTSNRLESVTDAAGNKTAYEYDLDLRKTTIHYLGDPDNPNDNLSDAFLTYDEAGYLTNYIDPLGNETIYTYNDNHNLTKVKDPLTHETQYTYNDQGHPTSIIDPLTHTLGEVDYNQYGGPTTMDTAQGGNASVQYDPVTFMPLSASDNFGSLGSYTWLPQDKGNPTTFTNQYGETTGYTYTPQGYVDTVTDPLGHRTHYAYDEFGRVTDVTIAYLTADASTTHYKYDELGRQIEVTVGYGTTKAAATNFEYDANGNRTVVVDPLERRTIYEYDDANRLILVTYAAHAASNEQAKTKYVYDVYSRLTDAIVAFGTPDESTTHYTYYDNGLKKDVMVAFTKSYASTTHYEYYSDGRVRDVTIAYNTVDAATTHYIYDAAGRMTDVTIAYGTPDASTTHYEYYDSGLTRSMTTAYGTFLAATTSYFYDTRGRSTYTKYPDQTTVDQYYDPMPTTPGWSNSTVDQAGVKTTYIYDAAGRLDQLDVSAVDISNGQTLHHISNYDYDAANRMTDSFDPMEHYTSFTYYPTGQMESSTAWLNATTPYTTTYDYNPAGEQVSVEDANQHVTQFQYNERGLLKKTIYPLGPGETVEIATSQTYDFAGRLLTATDENGIVTRNAYNAAGQLIGVTMADGTADATLIQYGYNFAGELSSITDAKSHVTSFLYNDAGRQIKKTLPDNTTYEQFGYNAAGNMVSHRLGDGKTNTFRYDSMNRLTDTVYFDGRSVVFEYTDGGQRKKASLYPAPLSVPQVYMYAYDPFERLQSVTYPDGRPVSYTYTDNDLRETMTTPAGTTTYGYNTLDRLTSVSAVVGGSTQTTTYEYDPVGFLTDEFLPNGVHTEYTPNERNQLTNVVSKNSSGATLLSFAYDELDHAGNRKKVTQADGSYIQWNYDTLYRLTGETRYNSSDVITWQSSFTYDDAGNRDSMTVNGSTTNYVYNALDQLTSAGTVAYDYDGRGNLWHKTNGSQITTYAYNAADQLTNVSATGINATYAYDADGRRVKQTIGSAITNYLWDEASPYGDVVYEYNASGSPLASYVLAGTEILLQTRSGTTNYYLQDGQGSTRALTNNTGVVTDTYSYTAFGELFNQTGSTTNSYLYTGQQFDSLAGLYDLRARYYNPALGRFLSQDTYPFNLGNPVEFNRYTYTGNNPVNLIDPSGHEGEVDYSIILSNVLRSAKAGAELGFKVGAVYGIVASLFCTNNISDAIGLIATSAVTGYLGGGLLGGIAGVPALVGLAEALGATGGLVGYAMAAEDMRIHGANGCNIINMAASLVAFTGSSYSGLSGGGPSMQLAYAGVPGGTSASVIPGVAGNTGIWGALGLASMMSGGSGENSDSNSSNKVQRYLRRLPNPGDRIEVQPGEIDFKTLARLQGDSKTGDEFLLLKSSDGKIYLFRGGMTIKYPPDMVEAIAHSHPYSRWHASRFDYEVLDALGQDSSFFITESGFVRQYFRGGSPEAPLESEGYYIDLR